MSRLCRVILTPIDSFYFGGEESFTSPKLEAVQKTDRVTQNYFKKRQGYFAKSEIFPQQTQLLGMLRKEILKLNGYLKHRKRFETVDRYKKGIPAKSVVGDTAWSTKGALHLGMIERLSPLYLWHNHHKKLYVPLPFDDTYKLETQGIAYINGKPKAAVRFKSRCEADRHFGAKDQLCTDFCSLDGERAKLDEIFVPTVQTHTQTGEYKKGDEEKYFKVKRYILKEYSFCFYLSFSNDSFLPDSYNATVSLGGERSYFRMHIEKMQESMTEHEQEIDNFYQSFAVEYDKIVLLSDTYIDPDDDIFAHTIASMANKRILRTIGEIEEKKEKEDPNNKQYYFKKSEKTVLLTRGSLFYPKDKSATDTIVKAIEKQINFKTIGYNRYTIIKGAKR